jgi:hypothetical protein
VVDVADMLDGPTRGNWAAGTPRGRPLIPTMGDGMDDGRWTMARIGMSEGVNWQSGSKTGRKEQQQERDMPQCLLQYCRFASPGTSASASASSSPCQSAAL